MVWGGEDMNSYGSVSNERIHANPCKTMLIAGSLYIDYII